jgi:hypothetical protein
MRNLGFGQMQAHTPEEYYTKSDAGSHTFGLGKVRVGRLCSAQSFRVLESAYLFSVFHFDAM